VGFDSSPIADIVRWKWRKLIVNLGNAVEAICGPAARKGVIGQSAAAEGLACLAAAGIDAASEEEDQARRGDLLQLQPVAGRARGGGSTWQSLARLTSTADYLNGEVVLLGRLHGVATPVNLLLQQLAANGDAPGSITPAQFQQLLSANA
jgi:2-dehydropantoate 2-reductase